MNQSVSNTLDDRYFGQLSLSQASRTQFTPGVASSRAGDMNWPTDFLIPTGNSALDVSGSKAISRVRNSLVGRNTVCDQTLVFVPAEPETTTQENDGRKERNSGYDGVQV
jgi:hypothetical protein